MAVRYPDRLNLEERSMKYAVLAAIIALGFCTPALADDDEHGGGNGGNFSLSAGSYAGVGLEALTEVAAGPGASCGCGNSVLAGSEGGVYSGGNAYAGASGDGVSTYAGGNTQQWNIAGVSNVGNSTGYAGMALTGVGEGLATATLEGTLGGGHD